jgi:hypothetical protein
MGTRRCLAYSSLCYMHLNCPSMRACTAPGCVCLQELLCCTWEACTCACPSTRAFVLHLILDLPVFKSLCSCAALVCVCLEEHCAAPGLVCLHSTRVCAVYGLQIFLFDMFRKWFVCLCCFKTCSKHRNKPKNLVSGFMKQIETHPKQIGFRFFSVLTENIFVCFGDTLLDSKWIIATSVIIYNLALYTVYGLLLV